MFINSAYGFSLNFGKGKTTLFSDFDGTYMPFRHEDIFKNKHIINREEFYDTFDNLRKFMTKKADKFELNITSGRNIHEWRAFVNKLEKMGLKTPLPKKMIASNGADVFIKTQANNYVHEEDSDKEEEIRIASCWTKRVRKDLINSFKQDGYTIIEPYINSSENEYDKELTVQKFFPKDDTTKFASFRKDDELHLNILFNKSTTKEEFNNIEAKIKNYLSSKNIYAKVNPDYAGKYSGGYPVFNIVPLMEGGKELTKLYDINKELEHAKEENDIVVVAGDGKNDKEMLNPLNYIDLPENIDKDNLDVLKDYFNTHLDKKAQLRLLPFAGIVIADENKPKDKLSLKPDFIKLINDLAGAKKLFLVQKGELHKGLEEANNEYAKINKIFKKNMKVKELTLNHSHGTFMQIDDKMVIGPQMGKKMMDNPYYLANEKQQKRDLALLKPFEISDMIDLRNSNIPHETKAAIEQEKEAAEKFGINHHSIEFDAIASPTKDEIKSFFDIIKNAKGRVYLHCHIGQDRTSMFAAMYVAYTQGRTLEEIEKYLFDSRNLFKEDGRSKKWQYMKNPLERAKFFSLLEKLRKSGRENNFDINKFDIEKIKF